MWNTPSIFSKPDLNTPKKRPPKATPVQLPLYGSRPLHPCKLSQVTRDELRKVLIGLHPSKWQSHDHQRFGIELTNGLALESLVPQTFIPPVVRDVDQSHASGNGGCRTSDDTALQMLSNGKRSPDNETFLSQVAELECEYEDALNILAREKPRAGSTLTKLTHLRKFWMSIDTISRYWDTSKDTHHPQAADITKATSDHTEAQKRDPEIQPLQQDFSTFKNDDQVSQTSKYSGLRRYDLLEGQTHPQRQENDYYGWRNATGRDMPNTHRQEMIANFIEPIVRAMSCHHEPSSLRSELPIDPKRFVQVLDGRIRVPISGLIYRIPAEPKAARQGWNEGPVMAISVRSNVNFSAPMDEESEELKQVLNQLKQGELGEDENEWESSETLQMRGFSLTDESPPRLIRWQNTDVIDASKEIGALLMLAQFRFRNARSEDEIVTGKNKWWAENRRCGGLNSEQTGNDGKVIRDGLAGGKKWPYQNDPAMSEDSVDLREHGSNELSSTNLGRAQEKDLEDSFVSKRQRLSEVLGASPDVSFKERETDRKRLLAISRKPLPVWDHKTYFFSVGKTPSQTFDHVYLISSLFHHVSIICMRIHPSMLEFLSSRAENLTACVKDMMQLEHFGLYLRRSRWYDLLLPQDRVEAFRAIWAVMRYMMRDTVNDEADATHFAEELSKSGKIVNQSRLLD